jgi:hypothetical protein
LKRFPGEATKFDGSFQEFGFGTVIVRQWLDCDEDRVYFLNEKDLFVCEQKPFGVYNDDGNECGWQWEPLASAQIAGWARWVFTSRWEHIKPEASR